MSVFQGAARRTSDQPTDLSRLTKAQLVAIAKERGVEVPRGATKERIIEILGR